MTFEDPFIQQIAVGLAVVIPIIGGIEMETTKL